MDDESPTPCDYCGAPLGSGPLRDVIMIQAQMGFLVGESDRIQQGNWAFCNEAHFHEWTAEGPLLFESSTDDSDVDEEGFQYGGLIVVLVVLALAIFGAVSLVRAFV